jgi:hypothetical protein
MALSVSADCRSFWRRLGSLLQKSLNPPATESSFAPVRGQMSAAKRKDFYIRVGQEVEVSKTFGESDICHFCGITGGLFCNPVDEPGGKLVEG